MPNWSQLSKALRQLPKERPVLTSLVGAGAGALAAGTIAPEEKRRQMALLGAGAGAAGGLIHPDVRKAVANFLKRQAFGYVGKAPKSFRGTTEEYLRSIQSHRVQNPSTTPGAASKAWEKVRQPASKAWEKLRRAAGREPREYQPAAYRPEDRMADIIEQYRAGMSSIPSRMRELIRDPRGYARKWWKHGGKREALVWAPLALGSTALSERGATPEERRKDWGESVGSTLGWMAASGLPASVWYPASYVTGRLGKTIAGIKSNKTERK